MAVMVGLLRGVNVGGGRTKVAMADLRGALAHRGFDEVRSYIQSGNVVLRTNRRSTGTVARELESAVSEVSDVTDPTAVVLTLDEWGVIVAGNPFAAHEADPRTVHVVVSLADEAPRIDLDLTTFAPEEAAVVGRCTYLWLPDGMARSPLATALARQALANGTTRNWRTVTKLLSMAEGLA